MDSAEFLDLLGNANRRRILRLLAQKPCYVTEISEHIGVSPKAVIDHLRKLEEAGLVESRTDERRRKYFSISRHVHLEVTVSPYEFGTRSAYPSNSRLDISSCRQLSLDVERLDERLEAGDEPDERDAGEHDGADAESPAGERLEASERAETEAKATAREQGETGERASQTGGVDGEAAAGASTRGTTECGPAVDDAAAAQSGDGRDDGGTSAGAPVLARRLHDLEQLERELSLVHRWTEGRINQLREHLAERVEVGDPRMVSELLVALAEEPCRMEELCRHLNAPPPVVEELLDVLADQGVVRREGRYWQLVE